MSENSPLHIKGKAFVESVSNRKPYEIIKVHLRHHPYKIEYTPFLLATGIKVYGYNSMLLEMGNDITRVVDIIGTEYIKSVEVFNPLDLKNYKYVKQKQDYAI